MCGLRCLCRVDWSGHFFKPLSLCGRRVRLWLVSANAGFFATMWSRHFAFYIYEYPLVLAIKLGVTDLAWLRLAYGLGRFLPWPLVLLACRWLSPKHFWLAAVGCAAGYLNAAFTADATHNLAHAFLAVTFCHLVCLPAETSGGSHVAGFSRGDVVQLRISTLPLPAAGAARLLALVA